MWFSIYGHKKVSRKEEKNLVKRHLIESPRERMRNIEVWLKCSVGQKVEVYGWYENKKAGYLISGKFIRFERGETKSKPPLDVQQLTMIIDQGKNDSEHRITFAENSNSELVGRIKDSKGQIIYEHVGVLSDMDKYLKNHSD